MDSLLTTHQNTRNQQRRRKRSCRIIKKLFHTALNNVSQSSRALFPANSYIKVAFLIERSAEVELYRYLGFNKTGYAICPNCGYGLEREYQRYCEVCGQILGWKKFSRGDITVQRKIVLSKEDRNIISPKSPRSICCEQHFLRWGGLKDGRMSYYSIKKKGRNQSGATGEAD